MNGYLLIDKPSGWTSFDVVAKVRSCLRQQLKANSSQPTATSPKVKVGHTGTLDPLATGLLVILVGDYTKRALELSKVDKTYEVIMTLGVTSSTDDEEGGKKFTSKQVPSREEIQKALKEFVGEIKQTPPAFSAIKVGGQRAYKLARAGKKVELKPRSASIYSLQLTKYHYPKVHFIARVSSGTYVRSLVKDVGQKLGTGAYMSGLRRTEVGNFSVVNAIDVQDLPAKRLFEQLQVLD